MERKLGDREAAEWIRRSIVHKCERIPPDLRARTMLVLDARHVVHLRQRADARGVLGNGPRRRSSIWVHPDLADRPDCGSIQTPRLDQLDIEIIDVASPRFEPAIKGSHPYWDRGG